MLFLNFKSLKEGKMVGISAIGENFDVYVDALDNLQDIHRKEEEVNKKLEDYSLSEEEKTALQSSLRQIQREKKQKLRLFI
jgi:hypothetical protein